MLFLGCFFPKEKEGAMRARCRIMPSLAPTTLQYNLLEGIRAAGKSPRIINIAPVGTFPRAHRDVILRRERYTTLGMDVLDPGTVNLPWLKQLIRARRIRRAILRSGERELLIYSTYMPYLKAIHRLPPEYRVTVIVTDLLEDASYTAMSRFRRLQTRVMNRMVHKYLARVNAFVCLAEGMMEILGVGNRPALIMEGIAGTRVPARTREDIRADKRVLLYTGGVWARYGILDLLDAFSRIPDPRYELRICGWGDDVAAVKAAAERDRRIHFLGYLSKDEVYQEQRRATLLVNPRPANEAFTNRSFPSKTLEYMASGVPVLMHRLGAVPSDYDPHLYYFEGRSPEEMAAKIRVLCEQDDDTLYAFGNAAREFVLREKNPARQGERILALMRAARKG